MKKKYGYQRERAMRSSTQNLCKENRPGKSCWGEHVVTEGNESKG